ncbi:MAG: efflux RND transporter permease subunit [bacterium]|jgi:cobalt-zinc-cadmium resistance protein CzcA|nr:CusA/CzcA family heavy metal efflux RND transporter [Betaproteobacteria bacterium]
MIEAIVRASLQQRLVLLVIFVALGVFGARSVQKLSLDAFPDVTNIQVQVATEAPGRSPEEVERFVTVPIEIALTGLPGLREMRSLNRAGLSLVTLVFTDATDVYFARQLVLERLIEVQARLPQGTVPVLGPVSTGLGQVYQYTLERPDDGRRALTREELTERRIVQDWVVRPMLRGISGVAEVNSHGGYVRQYQVLADPQRMRGLNVHLAEIYSALERNNANSGGGLLPRGAEQYLIRGVGLVRTLEDIGNIVIKEVRGTPVFLRSVATITLGEEVRVGAAVKNGDTEAVAGIVMMIRGGNAREVVTRVKQRVEQINEQDLLPGGLKIVPFYDRTELVDAALLTIVKVLLEAIVFVVIILVIFLGDIRSSLIVVATLLLTPLFTFMVMNEYGISANLMSLGGLVIAIGLMVDGSVVVVENTFKRLGEARDSGENRLRIVLRAASEVGVPVVFGVGIIIVVFMPLLTLTDMEGKMFGPLAQVIGIALAISLVLSLTLTPILASYMLKGGADHDTFVIRMIKPGYLRLLDWSVGHEKTVVAIAVALLVAAGAAFPFLGTAFVPVMQEGSVTPQIIRVPSVSLEESVRTEFEAMKLVSEVPGVKMVVSTLGRGESPADPAGMNESGPVVSLLPISERPEGFKLQSDIERRIREVLSVLPGVQLVMSQPIQERVDEMVTGVRSQVAIKLFGEDLEVLRQKSEEIARVLNGIAGTRDLRLDRVSGQPYLTIDIDRTAIARYGINVSDVHDVIETAIAGRQATEVFEGERRFAAVVRYPEAYRNSVEAIGNILFTSPNGAMVPLKSLAAISIVDSAPVISRESGRRRIVIGSNVAGRDLGGYVAEAQARIAEKVVLPEGYTLEWGGQFENMERALGRLSIIVPITVAVIFFLLFILFKSVRYAALIILVLPFASLGGIFGLLLSGEFLSVPASVGFITLWGIATLNAVVLVEYIKHLRNEGLDVRAAVIEGCKARLRPVLMTASVAMLGLIPMLFASGPGSEVTRPLAVVVISGLITSTLLTLVVVPSLFKWFDEKPIEA